MAYYVVKADGKDWMNTELAMDILGLSAVEILFKTNSRELDVNLIFDKVLIGVSDKAKKALKGYPGVVVQDLDAEVMEMKDKEEGKEYTSFQASSDKVYTFNNTVFVELTSLLSASKYRACDKLPSMKVCGTLFIAVDKVKTGSNYTVTFSKKSA